MMRLSRAAERWWQKPLARFGDRSLPAELVVLKAKGRPGEKGAWLNSRGTDSGVVDLEREADGTFRTVRITLPEHVTETLDAILQKAGLTKGIPDLVFWSGSSSSIRFAEVKCPHWDRPSDQQSQFLAAASGRGIATAIYEWEFHD